MTIIAIIGELLLALARAFGLFASAKLAAGERAAGAAAQRAEDLSHEAKRIEKAARAGFDDSADRLPDRYDRDAAK